MNNQISKLGHTDSSLALLGQFHRELVQELSAGYLPTFSPYDCKPALWASMARKKILIPPEVFETMESDDSIEMWAVDESRPDGMRFVFAFGAILACSSYSIEKLAMSPWRRLFGRSPEIANKLIEKTGLALSTQKSQFEVADWHDVVELESTTPKRIRILVKSISPYKSSFGDRGIFALVKCQNND